MPVSVCFDDVVKEVELLRRQPEPVVPSYNAPSTSSEQREKGLRLIRQGWFWTFLLPPVGFRMLEQGRALANDDAYSALGNDPRRPVVYLRAFSTDKDRSGSAVDRSNATLVGTPKPTVEIQIAQAINNNFSRRYGPFIAIADPRQPPSPGFSKCHVDDAHWKRVAISMMEKSQLTILRIGEGDGIFWELIAAFLICSPSRTLLVFDPTSIPGKKLAEAYREVTEALAARFQLRFPSTYNGSRVIRFSNDRTAILESAGMLGTLMTGNFFSACLRQASRSIPELSEPAPSDTAMAKKAA